MHYRGLDAATLYSGRGLVSDVAYNWKAPGPIKPHPYSVTDALPVEFRLLYLCAFLLLQLCLKSHHREVLGVVQPIVVSLLLIFSGHLEIQYV